MKAVHNILFACVTMIAASCSVKQEEKKTPDTSVIPVKVMNLEPTGNSASIYTSGQFTTNDEALLSFKTGGVIGRIYVKEGDEVKTGQLLATLNMTEINAQLEVARIAYEKANRDYQRVENLFKDSVATLEQKQNVKTGLEIARQQLAAIEFNREYSQIRAPYGGYVLHKLASEGQVAGPGIPVFQVNGAKSGTWMLKVGVSDKEWTAIKIGDKATVMIAALNNKEFEGEVCRRSEGADPVTGSFNVDVKFSKEKPSVATGMFGKAIIHTSAKNNTATTWAIPYDALLDGDGNTGYVFVTNDGQNAQKIKVVIASMEKDKITIADGLQNAHSIIVSGSAYLTDSSKIKVIN